GGETIRTGGFNHPKIKMTTRSIELTRKITSEGKEEDDLVAPVHLMSGGGIQSLKSFGVPAKCLVNQKRQVMIVVSNNNTNFGMLALSKWCHDHGSPGNCTD
ncbi:hypothetical protein HAX54_020083, partial [Datura stramonium]|nr:hypothetical protein [Datura stramonium]